MGTASRWLGGGLLVVLVLALGPHDARAWDHAGHQGLVAAKLELTAEQKVELERLGLDLRKEQIKRRAAARVARIELGQLLSARELDDKAIAGKTRELVDAEAALTRARLEHRAAVARLLKPEQREQARELWQTRRGARAGSRAHWGRRHGNARRHGRWPGNEE